jgi:hypothetical protein
MIATLTAGRIANGLQEQTFYRLQFIVIPSFNSLP